MTVEDLKACQLIESAHYNGGRAWFGYGYRCVEHPRLQKVVKYYRKDKSTEVSWRVDGEPVEGLEGAAAALSVPPVLTEDETAALALVPADWAERPEAVDYLMVTRLRDKGQVEARPGREIRRLAPA